MARKVRVQYAGAIYHVMNRGDHQESIFCDDDRSPAFPVHPGRCLPKVPRRKATPRESPYFWRKRFIPSMSNPALPFPRIPRIPRFLPSIRAPVALLLHLCCTSKCNIKTTKFQRLYRERSMLHFVSPFPRAQTFHRPPILTRSSKLLPFTRGTSPLNSR